MGNFSVPFFYIVGDFDDTQLHSTGVTNVGKIVEYSKKDTQKFSKKIG